MQKVLIISGPTASGKTDFALNLSSSISSSIVSADSIQVYKGLDVISGKDAPKASNFQPFLFPNLPSEFSLGYYTIDSTELWMVDVVDPSYSFNVHDYLACSKNVIEKISSLEKLPIVVGGTGLYIKALLDGIETNVIAPDQVLRKKLEIKSVDELFEHLQKLNIDRASIMNESDKKNKRRLTRAIEIALSKSDNKVSNKLENIEVLFTALSAPRDAIKKRIDDRIDKRLKEGAIEEGEKLYKVYDNLSYQVKNANGYKQVFSYLKNEISKDEMIQKWKYSEYSNAKKQMTWLRKDNRVKWFDIADKEFENNAEEMIRKWLEE